jgi:hypothetical protein
MVSTHIHAMDSEGQRGDGKQRMDRDWFGSKSNWIAIGFVLFPCLSAFFFRSEAIRTSQRMGSTFFFSICKPKWTHHVELYYLLHAAPSLVVSLAGPITGMIEVVSVLFSVSCCTVSENIQMLVALCGDGENGMHAMQVDFADLQVQIA